MSKKVDYFVKAERVTSRAPDELVEMPAQWTPVLISCLEGRKGRSFWSSFERFVQGYDAMCAIQGMLLMGAKEDIIREIREARGPLNGTDPSDLDTFPVATYPGWTLGSIGVQLNDGGTNVAQKLTTANATLDAIKLAIEAQGGLDDDMLAQLVQIAGLLAV